MTIVLSLTLRPKFAIEYVSDTQIKSIGPKFGEEGVDRCKPNFNAIWDWERHGAVVCRRNHVDIFCRLSPMRECDKQTNKQTNHHGTVTTIAIATYQQRRQNDAAISQSKEYHKSAFLRPFLPDFILRRFREQSPQK